MKYASTQYLEVEGGEGIYSKQVRQILFKSFQKEKESVGMNKTYRTPF